jgi:hypothetical protein
LQGFASASSSFVDAGLASFGLCTLCTLFTLCIALSEDVQSCRLSSVARLEVHAVCTEPMSAVRNVVREWGMMSLFQMRKIHWFGLE